MAAEIQTETTRGLSRWGVVAFWAWGACVGLSPVVVAVGLTWSR